MRSRSLVCATLLLVAGSDAPLLAETLQIDLTANVPVERPIDSTVDDRNYISPRAYRQHGAATRFFQHRLTLRNTGTTTLTGPLLVINERDWSSPEALRRTLQASEKPSEWLPSLFSFWCTHVSHADSDAPGGKEPLALLNFWSYALCGDTTAALTHLVTSQGVPARKIPLNGHVAAEYYYDSAWHIFDTDQNVVYLALDNLTLASAADLRADPFLARRTKVFGRYASMEPVASAFNTSLHEFIQPTDEKAITHKKPPMPVRADTLFPGEKLIIYSAQAPEKAVGRTKLQQWGTVREDALCLVEFALDAKARQNEGSGEVTFASGYPILAAVNHTTGETVSSPAGQPTFDVRVKVQSPADQVSVYTQRARSFLPFIQKGSNQFLLAVNGSSGSASLIVDWEAAPADLQLPTAEIKLTNPAPEFAITSTEGTDLVWWQIAADPTFSFVAPNLDTITLPQPTLRLDPFTATFLNPDQAYHLRMKARRDGVWGEWSAPLEFRVEKPARPSPAKVDVRAERLHLSWPSAGEGCDYLVFGSNRLDFLPELFAADEIVKLREVVVEETKPNKNLVATVATPEVELEPAFRFYRVIARRGNALSVPSELIRTPAALASKLPAATVLQDRWKRVGNPANPGAEKDAHFAEETVLP